MNGQQILEGCQEAGFISFIFGNGIHFVFLTPQIFIITF
jgi:hypothetical protein